MKFRLILIAIGLIAGIYSCSNSTENSDVLTKPTIEILASDPVPMQIKSIINVLGLAIEKPNPYINSPSDKEASILSAKEGVIVEFGFNDEARNNIFKFKINENESDKNKMVYYGTGENKLTGKINDWRRTISVSSEGLLVQEEVKLNGQYVPREKLEYVVNGDKTVDEYFCKSSGAKEKNFTYLPNTPTSLIKKSADIGEEFAVDNISVIQK